MIENKERKNLINRTIRALENNNMKAYYAPSNEEYFKLLEKLVKENDVVSVGGSMTLFETGTIDWLSHQKITFLNRYAEGLTPQDINEIYYKSFNADVYFTSSNALTETGNLYNVDGRGNRVAAMIYGPRRVIVVVGVNKIVKDDKAAIMRNREIAAPLNAKRLNRKTPCVKTNYCIDCESDERICSAYVFLRRQMVKDRIHVIILNDNFGY